MARKRKEASKRSRPLAVGHAPDSALPKYLNEPKLSVRRAAYWATLDARRLGSPFEYSFLDGALNGPLVENITEQLNSKSPSSRRSAMNALVKLLAMREAALQRESNERVAAAMAAAKESETGAMERTNTLSISTTTVATQTVPKPTGTALMAKIAAKRLELAAATVDPHNLPVIDAE